MRLPAQARALAATGMVPAAMRYLQHATSLDPENAEACFAVAMLHTHMKAWPEAEQVFYRAAKLRAAEGNPVQAALCWIGVGAHPAGARLLCERWNGRG